LGDDDAADDSGVDFGREIVGEEMGAGGVTPTPIKCESEEENVAPIGEQRGAVVDEFGEKRCGKWSETYGAEEADVDPSEIAVGAGEIVELGLLANPEDAVGHDAHEEDEQARRQYDECATEIVFGVNGFGGGDAEVEDKQRHGDGEDAVAECGNAFHALTGNTVVEGVHPTKFSIGVGVGWRLKKGIRELAEGAIIVSQRTRHNPRLAQIPFGFAQGRLSLRKERSLGTTMRAEFAEKGRGVRGECVGGMRQVAGARDRACGALVMVCLLVVMCPGAAWAQGSEPPQNPTQNPSQDPGQTPGKEPPDAPGESKKDESANPVQQVQDRTKQAVGMTKDVATAGLLKARDWESSRIAGIYVGKNRKLLTLSAEQRKDIYLKQTLTTPEAYVKRMFGALLDQASGTPRQWQGGIGGFGERWASREGQFIAANSLAALGNAKLGYEVRYDRCKCDGLWPRTRHAFIRNLLTYDRSEEHLHPQWALYGGAFGGGALSAVWKPGSQNALTNGAYGMLGQLGYGTLLNFVTEFAQEINRKQGVK